jgi:biotin-dependent carboxylase-like uncharacterized protein
MIEVVRAGLLDLVMDLGRPGFRAQGVPAGGAADAPALTLANRLVGNADGAAGLELLLQGPVLCFPRGGRIALAGADMGARLDGVPVSMGQAREIPPGGTLELGLAEAGLRTYLAVAGEIQAPAVLGSRSTFLPGGFGGWQGRALRTGDLLPIGCPAAMRTGGHAHAARASGGLRILPGPQLASFGDNALHALAEAAFCLSTDSNRLGLRLSGPALDYAGGELLSQAVLPGTIQVPPDGQAIILGWDGPVTGGYPVIAGIVAADLHRLAQLRPGDKLDFQFITPGEARAAWHRHQASLNGAIAWDA